MKRFVIVLTVLVFLTACKTDDAKYQSGNTVYTLDAYLDTEEDLLIVEGEVSYYNDIPDLDELYLHVYPNTNTATESVEANVQFEYLQIDGVDQDTDFSGYQQSYIHFELDEVVPVDTRISIEFKYSFHYWNIDRLNVIDNSYYMTMFFYPFVPVYDEDGWNIEPYSFRGESYFNTLGDYYVTLNVPDDYLVAASGQLTNSSTKQGRLENSYEILNARDFSFSASDKYHHYTKTIEERTYEIYSIESLTTTQEDLYFGYVTTTFDVMEAEVGPYDYDHFTLELGYIYGMESTGVIYCDMDVQEGTVAHEVIHQWFYSMIGNDQSDEPFLDEALTTYMTAFYFDALYGSDGYNGYLDYRSSLKPELDDRFKLYQGVSILRHISEYGDGYAYLVYYHGPTIYRYYVEYFLDGDTDRFLDALQVYYNTYKYDIVTIDEFFTLLEETTNEAGTKAWLYEQANDLQDLELETRD